MIDLSGMTALVTGAGQGIGRAIAIVLAKQGAQIAVSDINEDSAKTVANEINQLNQTSLAFNTDVSSAPSVNTTVEEILSTWGQLDILVNNAGVYAAPGYKDVPEDRDVDWDIVFDVNVKGIVRCCKAIIPHMKKRRYGKIINIASIAGRFSNPIHLHYAASKAAVINYTQGIAREMAPHNVNVNAICPGILWTSIWATIATRMKNLDPSLSDLEINAIKDKSIRERIPLNREQTPEDIGKAVAFLASEDARNITGQSIQVDGGSVMI